MNMQRTIFQNEKINSKNYLTVKCKRTNMDNEIPLRHAHTCTIGVFGARDGNFLL